MKSQELNKLRCDIYTALDVRRLTSAISLISETAHQQGMYDIEEKTSQIKETYHYMLQYLAQGVDDPQRPDIYNDLVNDLYALADKLIHTIETVDSPSLYFSKIRYMKTQPKTPLAVLLQRYHRLYDETSLFNMVLNNDQTDSKDTRLQLEALQRDIFVAIWCSQQFTESDSEAVMQALDTAPTSLQYQIVSALWLGMMQMYDSRKLRLLMLAYLNAKDIDVSSAALVGLLLSLWRYKDRPLTRANGNILMSIKEKDTWARDLRIAYIELIRAQDTERINRKMHDEVITPMQGISSDIREKLTKVSLENDDPLSLQENPEWQELLEKSGVADRLKEITEIQMEGGDVMMSTFAHLKSFPFFNEISNWFMLFDANHTAVSQVMKEMDIIGEMMENAKFLCDSDKYSFMMSLKSVPNAQRELMVSQMKAQSESIYEVMSQISGNEDTPEYRRLSVNHYVQNIYRFYKLFYRKPEFFDPFTHAIELYDVPSLASDFEDTGLVHIIAEFYFKLQRSEEAIRLFSLLDAREEAEASRYQKMGYCYEKLQKYTEAIKYYQRSELLDNGNMWTTRRLATCYRHIGDKSSALIYYRCMAQAEPDNLRIAMLFAQSLIENDQYQKAINVLYKIEFMDESNKQVWRPLAWSLMLTGNFDKAQRYYDKIETDDTPTSKDLLNMGYLAVAKGDVPKALNTYLRLVGDSASARDNLQFLRSGYDSDESSLKQAGIDTSVFPLIFDLLAKKVMRK